MEEINAGIITNDVDVTAVVGLQSTGECGEVRERFREREFEEREEVSGGEWRRREKNALLDVLTREHREIGYGEFEGFEGGFLIGIDGTF